MANKGRKKAPVTMANAASGIAGLIWRSLIWRPLILALAAACGGSLAGAQSEDLMTVAVDGVSQEATAAEAARDISEKTMAQVAREQTIEIIGDKKYLKHKALIEAKIVREAQRFTPYMSPGEPVKAQDGGWRMQVEMKISRSSLRFLLAKAGLLAEADGPSSALPMMSAVDRVHGVAYRWWLGEADASQKFLAQLTRLFHQALYSEFSKIGFYAIRPTAPTQSLMPDRLRVDHPTPEALAALGSFFEAPVIVQGETRLRESAEAAGAFQASVRLTAVQASNGRPVGEVTRAFETDVGSFEATVRSKMTTAYIEVAKDLGAQILDVWQKGALGSNLIRLALKGNLSPRQLEAFKAGLLRSVREVKTARERLFEPGQVTLELESSATPSQLSERLRSAQIQGFQMRVASAGERSVMLDVSTR